MDCKSCRWAKIYDYEFPEGTKTIACEKYNKHLGFTNKKGQVVKVKHIAECRGQANTINSSKGETEIITNKAGIYFNEKTKKYEVKVNDNGKYCNIATTTSKERALQVLEMFKAKKSFVSGIYWETSRGSWVCRVYDKNLKRYVYLKQSKYFTETLKALSEFKGGNQNVGKKSK